MMISKHSRSHTDENQIKIDLSTIGKFLKIFPVLLIIFTIIYFTCFGCFLVFNDSTSLAADTVILSSEEGPVIEMFQDIMGEYQFAEEEKISFDADGSRTVYNSYQHIHRVERFLIYNIFGTTEF